MFLWAFQDWFKLTESWLSLLCYLGLPVCCACCLWVSSQLSRYTWRTKLRLILGIHYKTPNGHKSNYCHTLPHHSFSAVPITISEKQIERTTRCCHSVFIKKITQPFRLPPPRLLNPRPSFTCSHRWTNPKKKRLKSFRAFYNYLIFTFSLNFPLGKKTRVGSHQSTSSHCF